MSGENVVKTLGEVCKINYGKRVTRSKNEGTKYLTYGGGNLMNYKVDEFNRDGIIYKISRDGLSRHNCITKIYGKIFLNDTALTLDTLNNDYLNNHYIGEYLLSIKNYIYDNCTHGTAQLHIDIDNLKSIKIPIPSLERQKEIVEYCEFNDTLIKQLEQEIENNKKQAQLFITSIVKNQVKEQDDIISLNTEPTNEVQNEIVYVGDDVVIEPNPKTKIIIKKKVNKPLKIIEV
jgi:restriction endonuclease S subunit